MNIFLLLLLFSLSPWSYNTIFLNLYFCSMMYLESFQFRSLTITLFIFANLWQVTISIPSNTTSSFSKINRMCSLYKSFVMLLRILAISINSRREYCSSFSPFLYFSFIFFHNWYFALQNFTLFFKGIVRSFHRKIEFFFSWLQFIKHKILH